MEMERQRGFVGMETRAEECTKCQGGRKQVGESMWEMMEGLVLEPCKRDEYVSSSICRSARSNGSHLTEVPRYPTPVGRAVRECVGAALNRPWNERQPGRYRPQKEPSPRYPCNEKPVADWAPAKVWYMYEGEKESRQWY